MTLSTVPASPYDILHPDVRWTPANTDLLPADYTKLMPPLVDRIRRAVTTWRDQEYAGASPTTLALLTWWFQPHQRNSNNAFRYYFAQREAIETIIYLYEIAQVKNKYDLMRYDASGVVSARMFDEDWLRFVIKMATGSGKTKVISLVITWCYFHKRYEPNSQLATNFLLIAPNIIVLDRLRTDFDGLNIFYSDPLLPDNGYAAQNWQDDFQLTLHIQDDITIMQPTGNLFLTNIHRVHVNEHTAPALTDDNLENYFLGTRPRGKTNQSRTDLGMILRAIDELVVINDEAHHIHDPKLAWFRSIEEIHRSLQQKNHCLALQLDVSATPRHNNGAIFVQTVVDYPLVEAIAQNVVKRPVLPDATSRAQLVEHHSGQYTERYADYIRLGVAEWRQAAAVHAAENKKAVLFIMTDDTKHWSTARTPCDPAASCVTQWSTSTTAILNNCPPRPVWLATYNYLD